MQFAPDHDFVNRLQANTKRYQTLFAQQADILLDPKTPGSIQPTQPVPLNTFDILMQQVRTSKAPAAQSVFCTFVLVLYPHIAIVVAESAWSVGQ